MNEPPLTIGAVPATEDLATVLAQAARTRAGRELVEIVDRRSTPDESTYPVEIVTCRFADGTTQELFCKYSAGLSHDVFGHRGGVGYEASVYEHVLDGSPVRTVGFFGAHRAADGTWLFLENLQGAERASQSVDPATMPAAAQWAGRFHAAHEATSPAILRRYDADYYRGWLTRTQSFAVGVLDDLSWLDELAGHFERVIETLLERPTIVHGEYYTKNLLAKGGVMYPVDWESAAAGAGEIDLAMLTEAWPADVVEGCEAAYTEARWPGGAPSDLANRLRCARGYVLLPWPRGPPSRAVP